MYILISWVMGNNLVIEYPYINKNYVYIQKNNGNSKNVKKMYLNNK